VQANAVGHLALLEKIRSAVMMMVLVRQNQKRLLLSNISFEIKKAPFGAFFMQA